MSPSIGGRLPRVQRLAVFRRLQRPHEVVLEVAGCGPVHRDLAGAAKPGTKGEGFGDVTMKNSGLAREQLRCDGFLEECVREAVTALGVRAGHQPSVPELA